jgi:hypothetical protein
LGRGYGEAGFVAFGGHGFGADVWACAEEGFAAVRGAREVGAAAYASGGEEVLFVGDVDGFGLADGAGGAGVERIVWEAGVVVLSALAALEEDDCCDDDG